MTESGFSPSMSLHIDEGELLDERSISDTVKKMKSSKSLDRLVNVFYQVKSTQDKQEMMEKEVLDANNPLAGAQSESLYSSQNLSQVLLPLNVIQKFDLRCWESFSKFSANVGDLPADSCIKSLPCHKLFQALDDISEKVRYMDIESVINKFHLKPDETLSWRDFKEFCDVLFEPLLHSKTNYKNNRKPKASLLPLYSEISAPQGEIPAIPATPFRQMMRKQRSVGLLSYNDLTQRTSTSTLILGEQIGNTYMPKGEMSDAMTKVIRNQKRNHAASISHLQSQPKLDSLHNTTTAALNMQSSELLVPLQKSTITEFVDNKSSYRDKWLKMRDKRRQRKESQENRKVRKDVMTLLRRTVVASDRNSMKQIKSYKEKNLNSEVAIQSKLSKMKIAQVNENKRLWKQQNALSKEHDVQNIKNTIKNALDESQALRNEELQQKIANRGEKFKLSEHSSTMVQVPEEMSASVKAARKLSEFKQASESVRHYIEDTLSDRFKTLARSKNDAMMSSLKSGQPVTLSPLKGKDIFHDPDENFDDNMLFVDYNQYMAASSSRDLALRPPDDSFISADNSMTPEDMAFQESIYRSYSASSQEGGVHGLN